MVNRGPCVGRLVFASVLATLVLFFAACGTSKLEGAGSVGEQRLSADAHHVWTQHYDNERSGATLSETILDTSNVNVSTFGKLFTRSVDDQIYAQPLYLEGLPIAGGTHNGTKVQVWDCNTWPNQKWHR